MIIERYSVVMTRLLTNLMDQIHENKRNHTYSPCKQWSDLVERRYQLMPTESAEDQLREYPSRIGDVILRHTYLSIIEEKDSHAANFVIPQFMKTYLWRNVSWDLSNLQEAIDNPSSEWVTVKKERLFLDKAVFGVGQTKPIIAIELFGGHPNILRNDVRVALVIELDELVPGEMDDSTLMDLVTSYLHGTGFDSGEKLQEPNGKTGDEGIAVDVDFITKYTIGITVSFDGDETISHEWSTDVFADDNNFAIKKARKLLKAYCRDDVQIVRTRIIRKKRYIAQNTDEE